MKPLYGNIDDAQYIKELVAKSCQAVEEIKRLTAKTEIDKITMDNFLGQLSDKDAQIGRLTTEVSELRDREENCCGMNPEGVADLEMRFEVLIGDYKTLHAALTKLSETHANPLIHDALRAVNDCWTPASSSPKPTD